MEGRTEGGGRRMEKVKDVGGNRVAILSKRGRMAALPDQGLLPEVVSPLQRVDDLRLGVVLCALGDLHLKHTRARVTLTHRDEHSFIRYFSED